MKTNQAFNKITIDSANRDKNLFGLAHDVNTTASIGDVQPLLCRLLVAKSNTSLSCRHLIRLDPMVAPTYGRLKAKCWNHFVGLSDLLPRSSKALLAKAPIAKGSVSSVPGVPSDVPNMPLSDLSLACLVGCSVTVYFHEPISTELPDASFTHWKAFQYDSTDPRVVAFIAGAYGRISYGGSDGFPGYTGGRFDPSFLIGSFSSQIPSDSLFIPFNAAGASSDSEAIRRFLLPLPSDVGTAIAWEPVPLNSADYVLRTSVDDGSGSNYVDVAFAVRLSAFGKRIRKILIGLGYQPNFSCGGADVDITPLFAYYKAYWDTFGLTLYDNWESSAANTLLSAYDAQESFVCDWSEHYWRRFVYDLGTTFVTEPQDYISAHQVADAINPTTGEFAVDKNRGFVNNIIYSNSANGQSGISQSNPIGPTSVQPNSGHVFINRVNHTEVDAELLKTLYKWTNRQTIAGKRIKELLEAGGYGDYVKECKSNFIGYDELEIDVTDINATADSTNAVTGKDSTLGSYVGKGVGVTRGDAKTMQFENDELGYWVTLFAIAPEAGYCQGLDPVLLDIDADHKYNPDFDGLGMELEPKLIVLGTADWHKATYSSDFTASFGMVPRHTKYKVAHNILNGDFSLRSARDGNLPFVLDKYLSFGDRTCELVNGSSTEYKVQMGTPVSNIPIAGNSWRYLNRYQWMANFERIFSFDEPNVNLFNRYVRYMNNLTAYELCSQEFDHFVCMNIMDLKTRAMMLPISDSYGTTDENDGHGDTKFTKA